MNAHPMLFEMPEHESLGPQRLEDMHRRYGIRAGYECQDCAFLDRLSYARTYLKCGKARQTSGPATDWRAHWTACGLWQRAEDA